MNSNDEIWTAIDELRIGMFRSAMGPGTIKNKLIRPKSIYAGTIDVSSLESVQQKTGSLNVTGAITVGTAGSISSGQTAYDTGVGFWLDASGGTTRFSLGNSGGSKITWQGTTLAVTGTITATAGAIGGFTIGATDLTAGSGTSSIGLSSAGAVRIWSGNATPSSAPFQVSSLGALTAESGTIAGWSIDSTLGLKLGAGASTRGISTGSTAFYAGSATPSSAPFNVTTAGAVAMSNLTLTGGSINLNSGVFTVSAAGAVTASNISVTGGSITGGTITANLINAGTLTFNAGGTINGGGAALSGTIGNSAGTLNLGKLTLTDTLTVQSGGTAKIVLNSGGAFGDVIKFQNGGVDKASIYADASTAYFVYNGNVGLSVTASDTRMISSTGFLSTSSGGISTDRVIYPGNNSTNQNSRYIGGNSSAVYVHLGDAAGTDQLKVETSGGGQVWGVNSLGDLVRPIANVATAEGTYSGRVPIYINGALRYISVHNA